MIVTLQDLAARLYTWWTVIWGIYCNRARHCRGFVLRRVRRQENNGWDWSYLCERGLRRSFVGGASEVLEEMWVSPLGRTVFAVLCACLKGSNDNKSWTFYRKNESFSGPRAWRKGLKSLISVSQQMGGTNCSRVFLQRPCPTDLQWSKEFLHWFSRKWGSRKLDSENMKKLLTIHLDCTAFFGWWTLFSNWPYL